MLEELEELLGRPVDLVFKRASGLRRQPCSSRRVVEQQPPERAGRVSQQQQQARQSEQQHRFPSRQYRGKRPERPPLRIRSGAALSCPAGVSCTGRSPAAGQKPATTVPPGIVREGWKDIQGPLFSASKLRTHFFCSTFLGSSVLLFKSAFPWIH